MAKKTNHIKKWLLTLIMVAVGLGCIYPFIFMLSSAFKPGGEVLTKPFEIITSNFTFANFNTVFNHSYYNMGRWYLNTTVMTVTAILLKVLIISITSYAFAKIRFPGRNVIFLVLLASMMIPGDIMIMPRYILYSKLGVINTMWALILPSVVDMYFVFMMRQSFLGISDSISEAAKIDGCSHLHIFARIVLPLASAGVTTMVLFSFVWCWNDYMSPYLYISDINKQMLSVGIKLLASGQTQDLGAQMAGATVVLIPIIVLFFFCQRYFVEGLSSGAVKG